MVEGDFFFKWKLPDQDIALSASGAISESPRNACPWQQTEVHCYLRFCIVRPHYTFLMEFGTDDRSEPGRTDMTVSAERAVLAGGCFWGVQDLLRRYPGVISTRVGYTGGEVPNATYRNHGNHAEAIEIIFDPQTISYRKLLEFFFQIHDPSTLNRQGNDRGASYRSAIFYTSDAQKRIAEDTIADVDASGLWPPRSSPKWPLPDRSGRPSPSIRIIWKNIQTATPVTSFGRNGRCRIGRRKLQQARAEFRLRDQSLRSAGGRP